MPTPTAVLDATLAHDVRIAVMRLARRLRGQRIESPLTLTQLSALATVERHGPLTPGDLATHERVQPPSMTRVIAALERLGLVVRTPHPTDRRQALVALSAAGSALLRADRRHREAWLSRQLADLSAAERDVLRTAAAIFDRLAQA